MEKILCAAIWYQDLELKKDVPNEGMNPKNVDRGIVFCGFRHAHCMYSMVAITGLRSVPVESGNHIQGFLTNTNRFVNRKEGLVIALQAGQVIDLNNIRGKNLYSEDLY